MEKKSRGKKLGKTLYLRFPADLHSALSAEANASGYGIAEWVRGILRERYGFKVGGETKPPAAELSRREAVR